MTSHLSAAINLAVQTHEGQVDLGRNQYILHPLRVLATVEERIRGLEIRDRESVLCSAVLHDCIEDSKYQMGTEQRIRDSFAPVVIKTVETLTRRPGQSWKKYINAVNEHWAPRVIKIADLEDNSDLSRLNTRELADKDINRLRMYATALSTLTGQEHRVEEIAK